MPSKKILARKKKVVEQLASELSQAKSIVFSNYQGLTVAQDTEMRSAFRAEKLKYRVVKNSISVRALEKIGITGVEEELKGPTALAFSVEDVVLAPRLVKKYADQFKKTQIKGGIVEGKRADLASMVALASIPSIEVLYGQLVGTLMYPVQKLAMTLDAMAKKAEECGVGNVGQLCDGSAAPVAAPAETEAAETAENPLEPQGGSNPAEGENVATEEVKEAE